MDLHLHSTASDGRASPHEVVKRAAAAGLQAIALTDHDTVAGVPAAQDMGQECRVRVIGGCEFSVRAWWGELHLLGYFIPTDNQRIESFLADQHRNRDSRAKDILRRLEELGVPVSYASVRQEAGDAPIGRPHIARAMVKASRVRNLSEAFDRYLADHGPAYCGRPLPGLEEVVALVRSVGGVTSAAHLKSRGTRSNVERLAELGVDAVEVLHPAHDRAQVAALTRYAGGTGLLMTGGSDWHGGDRDSRDRAIGGTGTPAAWLDALDELRDSRPAA